MLNFGWKNFFNALSGQAQYFQSILGRDYVIQRTGEKNNDTNYTFIGLDPITITGEWATSLGVPDGTPYDLGFVVGEVEGRSIPLAEVLYPDMPDLRRIVAERTSDDYYGRWFIPGWVPEGYTPGQQAQGQGGLQQGYSAPGAQAQPAPPVTPQQPAGEAAAGPTVNALDALKARVQGGTAAQ